MYLRTVLQTRWFVESITLIHFCDEIVLGFFVLEKTLNLCETQKNVIWIDASLRKEL